MLLCCRLCTTPGMIPACAHVHRNCCPGMGEARFVHTASAHNDAEVQNAGLESTRHRDTVMRTTPSVQRCNADVEALRREATRCLCKYKALESARSDVHAVVMLLDLAVVLLAVAVVFSSLVCSAGAITTGTNAILTYVVVQTLVICKLVGLFKFAVLLQRHTILVAQLQQPCVVLQRFLDNYEQHTISEESCAQLPVRQDAEYAVASFDKLISAADQAERSGSGTGHGQCMPCAVVLPALPEMQWRSSPRSSSLPASSAAAKHTKAVDVAATCLFEGYKVNFLDLAFLESTPPTVCLYLAQDLYELEEQELTMEKLLTALLSNRTVVTVQSRPVARWYYQWCDGDQSCFDIVRAPTALLRTHPDSSDRAAVISSELQVFGSRLAAWVQERNARNPGSQVTILSWRQFLQRQQTVKSSALQL